MMIDRILKRACDDDEKLGMILSNRVTHCLGDGEGMAIAEVAFGELITDLKKWKRGVYMKWIDINDEAPTPIHKKKILGHNGDYAFECEFNGAHWCNLGGESIRYWAELAPIPERNSGDE